MPGGRVRECKQCKRLFEAFEINERLCSEPCRIAAERYRKIKYYAKVALNGGRKSKPKE